MSDCTPRCRTATSTGSESQGLPAKPQPTEPPDTDPYVRWCGRGLTEGHTSVSPYPDQPAVAADGASAPPLNRIAVGSADKKRR